MIPSVGIPFESSSLVNHRWVLKLVLAQAPVVAHIPSLVIVAPVLVFVAHVFALIVLWVAHISSLIVFAWVVWVMVAH